jgi:hypothetical protein
MMTLDRAAEKVVALHHWCGFVSAGDKV